MPSVPLYPPPTTANPKSESLSEAHNALPPLLRTPSGLAILEIQGTINMPTESTATEADNSTDSESKRHAQWTTVETELGQVMFPDYSDLDPDSTKWMKRVYLYAGRYQRMTGEVKKLVKPLAIIQRRQKSQDGMGEEDTGVEGKDELEIVEIIKYKIIFATRPEPVGLE